MQKTDPLIRTKLRLPFTRPGLVSRPLLQEQVAQGLRGPLTLITAPAGFGKTTLVAASVAGCGIPVAWLSLDKDDNQPGRFLHYLVAALNEADRAIGDEAAQLLASQPAPPEVVLTSLVNDLDSSGEDMALVLDDYQLVTNPVVHEQVAFLLEHCPSTFHLVIATRSDPPLPLSRLRARGQTVELRAADLRFTQVEAVQFLNDVMSLHLDAGSVTVLEERTEGWIAGLQMAALSMRGRSDVCKFIQAFTGTNRFILDFLVEEVLSREPEEVQTFLLQTAILTRLTGPLCDAVTGTSGGQEMLERLERRNLFVVPLDDERRWYRYHHLFSDLLQARLRLSGAEQVAQLYIRAADWCEQDGQVVEAVVYAFAAQDYGRAAGLVERYWQQLANNGEIETVWAWLNALPEDMVRNSASLSIVCGTILWLTAQVGAIEPHLLDAERALSEQAASAPIDADVASLVVVMAVLRSFVARYNDDLEAAVDQAERALSLIPEQLPPPVDAQLRSFADLALGSAYDGAGELEKAVEAYAETIRLSRLSVNATGVAGITYRMIGVLRLLGRLRAADAACREGLSYLQAQGMGRLPAAGILHLAMSEVLVERNELEAAEGHLVQAIELGKWSGRLDTVKNAAYVLSRLRLARQDVPGALAAVQEAEAAMIEPVAPLAKAELLALKARVQARQGDLSEAARCVETAARLAGQDQGQTRENVSLAAARVSFAQGMPVEVIAQITQSLAAAEAGARLGEAIELHILRSLAQMQRGSPRDAEADLERALALAEPEGYARIFLDEGQPLQLLIAQWLAHASAHPQRNYAIRLLAQFELETQKAAPANILAKSEDRTANDTLIEPLSQRELEVLHLMALGRTNQEIAQQLIVASGTIKAHAASIYRKLDATNRTEAVARARQLGIIP